MRAYDYDHARRPWRRFVSGLCGLLLLGLLGVLAAAAVVLLPLPAHGDDFTDALQRLQQARDAERSAAAASQAALERQVAELQVRLDQVLNPRPQLPARMSVGLNLAPTADYGTDGRQANAFKTFSCGGTEEPLVDGGVLEPHWGKLTKPWEPVSVGDAAAQPSDRIRTRSGQTFRTWARQNADGYPLEDASSFSYLDGYAPGQYSFRAEGGGTYAFSGRLRSVFLAKDQATGVTTGVVLLGAGRTTAVVSVTGVDPANPPRNLSLRSQATPDGVQFNPWWVAKAKSVAGRTATNRGALRFMDATGTNASVQRTWADRRRPEEFSYTGRRGIPWEQVPAAAREVGTDVWVNVPHAADPDYVRRMIRTVWTGLPDDTFAWVEYSNEIWQDSDQFPQGRWLRDEARASDKFAAGGTDWYKRWAWNNADHLLQIGDAIRQELGDSTANTRVFPVLGGQAAAPVWLRYGLEWAKATRGNVARDIAAIAPAGYVGLRESDDVAGASKDGLFAGLFATLAGTDKLDQAAALATTYGVWLANYEGGQHVTGWNPLAPWQFINGDIKAAIQGDPRMGDLYAALLKRQHDHGVRLFMHFNDSQRVSPPPKWQNDWGLWPFGHLDGETVKSAAVRAWLAQPPPG
jgi:hypothetical protein